MSAEERSSAAVGAVVAAALRARGASRIALLDEGTPEAALAARWLGATVVRVTAADPGMEPLLHAAGGSEIEALRFRGRLLEGALVAHPLNKTALLLGGAPPPDPVLPLGDVWASEVLEFAGGWSAPAPVVALAQAVGGIHLLDTLLRRWLEGRDPAALDALSPEVALRLRTAFAAGRADRVHPRIVPKLTARTLGVDLFE